MVIHKVRQPFMCREGQFTPGKRELCIGLDLQTIKKTKSFWCYLGKNTKVIYEIDSTEALRIGHQWKNPKGKVVIIVPLSIARIIESKWDEEEYQKKEIKRAQMNQEKLFS